MAKLKKISVPGKLMLAGEYAVLFGGTALAYTVDSYLDTYVKISEDDQFHVRSQLWREEFVAASLARLPTTDQKSPLLNALAASQRVFGNPPLKMRVDSNLDMKGGMGSSSAVILGACVASSLFSQNRLTLMEIGELAYSVQKKLQGQASGYDIVTQLIGGLVSMQKSAGAWPGKVLQGIGLADNFETLIHPFAGGRGAPTGPVMKDTLQWLKSISGEKDLLRVSSDLCESFQMALTQDVDSDIYLSLMQRVRDHRKFFASSPHFPHEIAQQLESVDGCDRTWTFKTTGAGGEDAILIIGLSEAIQDASDTLLARNWYSLDAPFTANGLRIEDVNESRL